MFTFTHAHAQQARDLFAQLPGPVFAHLRELGNAAIYVDSSDQESDTLQIGPYSIVASTERIHVGFGRVPSLSFTVYESLTVTSSDRMTPDDVDVVAFMRENTFGDALRAIVLRETENYVSAIQYSDGLAQAYGETG
jgi:hypothetical protein